MTMDSFGRMCGFLGFACVLSKNYYAAIAFLVASVTLLRLDALKVDKRETKKYAPLDIRVEVKIKFEELNDIKFKDKSILKILGNKKDTAKVFVIRKTLKHSTTVIMVKEDNSEEEIQFPMYRVFGKYFEFEEK